MQFLNEREQEYSNLYKNGNAQINKKYYLYALQAVREIRKKAIEKWQK
tara:strand:- start:1167 stop:1310 length:144 start_codon:yes stop_codon:yes gene_type:complete